MTISSLDVITSIDLTASAAVVVATLSLVYPGPPRSRLRLAISLAAWFAGIAALCGLKVFDPVTGTGTMGLGAAILLPALGMIAFITSSAERRHRVLTQELARAEGVDEEAVRHLAATLSDKNSQASHEYKQSTPCRET